MGKVIKSVIFLQNRPHKAGAQTCLWRLLTQPAIRELWHPVVVCSSHGWLVEACREQGISVIIEPFPSSRSLLARAYGNGAFARRVAARLHQLGMNPLMVQGNDYAEGLLTRALARQLRVPSAIFLRSSGMQRNDYFKYQCHQCDWMAAIGTTLQQQVTGWDPGRAVHVFHDGVLPQEILPPQAVAGTVQRLLVIGSSAPQKGWRDVITALQRLQAQAWWHEQDWSIDFIGASPDHDTDRHDLAQLNHCRIRFLGRVNEFAALVRRYDLVINPSRQETFGMAAVEVLACGVPLISSRSGIIEQVIEDSRYLYQAGNAPALAEVLADILAHWPDHALDVALCQKNILNLFLIDHTVFFVTQHYRSLITQFSETRGS
ncbi:MAG: glycosyltransferase family 4 protein [Magnetococcales bacterium]|nr:glycosyltransferase family 4 protein [Magnetococcales bacterium]